MATAIAPRHPQRKQKAKPPPLTPTEHEQVRQRLTGINLSIGWATPTGTACSEPWAIIGADAIDAGIVPNTRSLSGLTSDLAAAGVLPPDCESPNCQQARCMNCKRLTPIPAMVGRVTRLDPEGLIVFDAGLCCHCADDILSLEAQVKLPGSCSAAILWKIRAYRMKPEKKTIKLAGEKRKANRRAEPPQAAEPAYHG